MSATSNVTYLTAIELGRLLRSGQTTVVEVVSAALERVAASEPTLHAYVEVFTDTAMEQARAADDAFQTGASVGPLHGVPVGVKDIVDMAAIRTQCGSPGRADVALASDDATVITRLRAAGAIPIGKTVTQEYAAGVVSAPARNPWDPGRIPGGSSGGSAASVAAGGCVVALGTDTGGSIRIPASVTGTVGLKPTYGVVPCRGIFPLAWSLDTAGPIARDVADAELVFNVLRGKPDSPLGAAESNGSLAGVRVGVPRAHFFEHLQPDVDAAIEEALTVLRDLGATVVEVDWSEAAHARAVSVIVSRAESSEVHARAYQENPDGFGPDIRSRLAVADTLPARDYVLALRAREAVKRSIAALYRNNDLDVLVTPTLCATAAPANTLSVELPGGQTPVFLAYTMLTMPFNATGQPVLSLPCGFDGGGLPIGLQIVGRPHDERHLCRIGRAYEQAAGWHTHHPPI
jgi:aspartyl-tRNA(Asn)/glutamyl-tRNA(Gln) amidotransferase subunit A